MTTSTQQSKSHKRAYLALIVLVSALMVPATLGGEIFNDDSPVFLSAEQAFMMSATYDGGDSVQLSWDIAPECYLYEHRFSVKAPDGRIIAHTTNTTPLDKTDAYFGKVQAYYDQVVIEANLGDASPGETMLLDVNYQGCADAGICYPPDQRRIQLSVGRPGVTIQTPLSHAPPQLGDLLKSASSSAPSSASSSVPSSASSSVPSSASSSAPTADIQDPSGRLFGLLVGGNIVSILALFFVAGIGLALTPCVLPMVPILSSIVIGSSEKGTRRAAMLSIAYVLGMALVYASLGALMGLFGASFNIQAALQQPWLLSVFAAIFAALALAMFGYYELRLPQAWQDRVDALARRQSGGLGGVMVVGALSALIVSPCVSAPLAGALVYIGTYQDATLGAAALFSLALGMGAPLILFGIGAGTLVPRAGLWMEQIKIASGIMLLGLAVWLLARWLDPFVAALLWGALALGTAAWLARIHTAKAWLLATWRLLALIALIYGIVLISTATAARTTSGTMPSERMNFVQLDNLDSINSTLASLNQPALLYFSADWCVSCRIIENNVFTNESTIAAFTELKLIKVDVTNNTNEHNQILTHFGLFGPPALLLFDRNGIEQQRLRIQGEFTASQLNNRLTALSARSPIQIK